MITIELRVIGCSAPYPPCGGATSGYLLRENNTNLLIDCGHGVMSLLGRYLDFRRLTAVFISHFHPDHFADLAAVRHAIGGALRNGERENRLLVFAPSRDEKNFADLLGWQDELDIRPAEDIQDEPFDLGALNLRTFPTDHSLPTAGLVVDSGKKTFAYTGDTRWSVELLMHLNGSDILLAEAGFLDTDVRMADARGHLTARQAATLAEKIGAEELLLTHFWPEMKPIQFEREAEMHFSGRTRAVKAGGIYKF